ncbi:hypothetical protein [Flavobacterium sp.]|jgi:hypothetical protein|uniref:hypothetical protein n=1 Tax=Flavobacterium sp. TaxID=239 RepID=UPI0037C05B16
MKAYKNISTFDQLKEVEHGKTGTESRNNYEEKSQMFIISEMLKNARTSSGNKQTNALIEELEIGEKSGKIRNFNREENLNELKEKFQK